MKIEAWHLAGDFAPLTLGKVARICNARPLLDSQLLLILLIRDYGQIHIYITGIIVLIKEQCRNWYFEILS
jgi:hypothetical protein